jgi:hypothetical protein
VPPKDVFEILHSTMSTIIAQEMYTEKPDHKTPKPKVPMPILKKTIRNGLILLL